MSAAHLSITLTRSGLGSLLIKVLSFMLDLGLPSLQGCIVPMKVSYRGSLSLSLSRVMYLSLQGGR